MSSTGITSPRLPLEPKARIFLITPTILRPFRTLVGCSCSPDRDRLCCARYATTVRRWNSERLAESGRFCRAAIARAGDGGAGTLAAIFRRVGLRDVLLVFGFAILNIIVSMSVGALLKTFGTVTANAGVAGAAGLEGAQLASYFAKVGLQLLGEELITILPFLALLWYLHARVGLSRNAAVLAAWLLSAIAFGLLHLPTYDWNVVAVPGGNRQRSAGADLGLCLDQEHLGQHRSAHHQRLDVDQHDCIRRAAGSGCVTHQGADDCRPFAPPSKNPRTSLVNSARLALRR